MTFGQTATERVSPNMPQFLPWLLDGADENTTVRVLGRCPSRCSTPIATSGNRRSRGE